MVPRSVTATGLRATIRHVTETTRVATAVFVVEDQRLLLIRQRRGTETWWEIPGGYLDAEESLQECAAREVIEETGVAVVIGEFACTLLWRHEAAQRSNVIVMFDAKPLASSWVLEPQLAENIDVAEFRSIDDLVLDDVHPMYREPMRVWLARRPAVGPPPFHYCEIDVEERGAAVYRFS